MTSNRNLVTTIEMLLSSITLTMGEDGARSSFFYGPPGAPHREMRMGIDIFYHFVELKLAALFVRSNGPAYLRALPLEDITSKLQTFISSNFWYLSHDIFGQRTDLPFNEWVSADAKAKLADALSNDPLFSPKNMLTLFPLVPISVEDGFRSDHFFLSSATDENPFGIDDEYVRSQLDHRRFPPTKDFEGPPNYPLSWLGVHSPDPKAALKIRSSILGALALTALPSYRHMFSGRIIFGGQCSISEGGLSYSFNNKHTPPCMHDIVVTKADSPWLRILSDKIKSDGKYERRQMKALEYFYRAWPKEPSERFPIMCMALDAIFGDANNATQAVIDGIRQTLGEHVSDPQLRALMNLRASVIHGGAPDVYDSRKYAKYYKTYQADPIGELELVVSACLQKLIFDDLLVVHDDPNAKIIAKAQAVGRLPKKIKARSILSFESS